MHLGVGARVRTFEKGKHSTLTYLWSVTGGYKQYRSGLFNTIIGRFGFIQSSNASFQYSDKTCILTSRGFLEVHLHARLARQSLQAVTLLSFTQKLLWANIG